MLFSDIVDFTKTSELLGPKKMSGILNEFLGVMIDTIYAHQGTIDKFIGDAIMVLFGAPQERSTEEQIALASSCAFAMQAALGKLNLKWQEQNIKPLSMRIGIHSGAAIVGTFGNELRSEYTAIGSTINIATRIEAAAEPGSILVSAEVRDYLEQDYWTFAGEFELKEMHSMPLFRLQEPLQKPEVA